MDEGISRFLGVSLSKAERTPSLGASLKFLSKALPVVLAAPPRLQPPLSLENTTLRSSLPLLLLNKGRRSDGGPSSLVRPNPPSLLSLLSRVENIFESSLDLSVFLQEDDAAVVDERLLFFSSSLLCTSSSFLR